MAVTWDPDRPPPVPASIIDTAVGDLTTMTSVVGRESTRVATRLASDGRRPSEPGRSWPPSRLEGRLKRSLDHGGFLALRVPTSRRVELRREMARFTGPHRVVGRPRTAVPGRAPRGRRRAGQWEKLLEADLEAAEGTTEPHQPAHPHPGGSRSARSSGCSPLASGCWPGTRGSWSATARWRWSIVCDPRPAWPTPDLQTLWLVVFGSTAEAKPSIDGEVLPVQGASEWVDITGDWLRNAQGSPSVAS